jgi:carboxymethylenebutenolidase
LVTTKKENTVLQFETDHGTVQAYEAVPAGGSGPGVLVLHAWWGLTPFFKSFCDRLAAAGFVVVAPDLHYGATADTIAEAEALIGLEGDRTQAAAEGGLAALRAHPAVRGRGLGAVGFSMGAAWALHLASHFPEDLAAVVVFYGTYVLDFGRSRAAFQGHFAEHDNYEPPESVRALQEALRGAGREVDFHTYAGTGHWFFESNQPAAYAPEAAELAWTRTIEFLRRYL